jgi:hypothetical protein
MAIDTLAYTKALEAAGVERRVAEAHAEALAEFPLPDLATKSDIERLEVRWTVLRWAVGINVALTVAILGVLLRFAGHG